MTKRINIICLVAFFLCLAGAFGVSRFSGGVENTHGLLRYVSIVIGAAIFALFPFSLGSFWLTRSWREVRKDKAKREFILKDPILSFLIWREELDGG
ncbi:hypothetical protein ELI54_14635 [Rhizobium ruizarguesonis]|nr:hypothetical protein ELI56_04730 [Rhizobium ruizarguesonis]TAT89355.1 hypothetical protein ELI54_14635 [Rhizobium ruizarguesonis]TAY78280.1 hypothetical protein ELH86_04530 [Rhizobium ruizarguesonis]TAZ33793.1 hypothetical protein ELH80_04740 [Rhizobium ruizarguesonis]TAZ72059.1 hypothetical protein ELH70_04860 [Rhizobium ruizarguesonis]